MDYEISLKPHIIYFGKELELKINYGSIFILSTRKRGEVMEQKRKKKGKETKRKGKQQKKKKKEKKKSICEGSSPVR
jgi:hypothetical protein